MPAQVSAAEIEAAKAVPITDIVGRDLKLIKRGRAEWQALCPFHRESTPSFTLYDDHYHCYGCGAHGDVISYLMRSKSLSFLDAVRELCGKGEPSRRSAARCDPTPRMGESQITGSSGSLSQSLKGEAASSFLVPAATPSWRLYREERKSQVGVYARAREELCRGPVGRPPPQTRAGSVRGELAPDPAPQIANLLDGAIDPEVAEFYLWTRGIGCRPKPLPPAIRGHRRVWCSETRQFRPALLAILTDNSGAVRAVQRTWCESVVDCTDGMPAKGSRSTDLRVGKKTLGRMGGASVRLSEPGVVLGLAEGIESAMSASLLFQHPCWATCGASRLGSIELPDIVEQIIIFGDSGDAGQSAAIVAARAYRRMGLRCDAEFPPPEFSDWNDFLRRRHR